MVNKLFYGVIIFLVIIGGIWGYFHFFRPSEKTIIINNLKELTQAASKKQKSGAISLALSSQTVDKLITDTIEVEVGYAAIDSYYNRYTFSNQIMRAKTAFSKLIFKIYDCEVTLAQDKKSAEIAFTVEVKGKLKQGQNINDVKDVIAQVRKNSEGKWQFSKFSLQQVVHK